MSDYYADDVVSVILLGLGALTVLAIIGVLLHTWLTDATTPLPPRPVRRPRCAAHCTHDATREVEHVDGGIVAVCEGHYAEGVMHGWLGAQEVAS